MNDIRSVHKNIVFLEFVIAEKHIRQLFSSKPELTPFSGVGTRLLMIDYQPQGAYARYPKDVNTTAYVVHRGSSCPWLQ